MDETKSNAYNSVEFYNKSVFAIWENSTNNQTSFEFENLFNHPFPRVVFVACYVIVFSLCFFGNSMVLFAIARNKRLRSRTNFLLANLAVADFSVGVFCVLPNLSTFLSPVWVLGRVMCKVYYFVWNQSYTASITILTVIAVERFLAIKYPLKARQWMTSRKLKVVQSTIWIISIVYNIQYLIVFDTIIFTSNGHSEAFCYYIHIETKELKVLFLINFIVWYIIPLSMMALLYSKIAASLWKGSLIDDRDLKKCVIVKSCTCSQRSATYEETELANYADAAEVASCDNIKTCTSHTESSSKREEKKYISYCNDCSSNFSGSYNWERYSASSFGDKSIRMVYTKQGSVHGEIVTETANDSGANQQTLPVHYDGKHRHGVKCIRSDLSSSNKIRTAKRKVIRLLIVLVVSFAVCVLPHHIRLLLMYWQLYVVPFSVEVYLAPTSFIILYLNSGLNPILYALFSNNFRRSFKDSFNCCNRWRTTRFSMDTVKHISKYQERVKEIK